MTLPAKHPTVRYGAHLIELIARTCHETNKAICETFGDFSQKSWEKAEPWQRESANTGVIYAMENPGATPEDQHEAWCRHKRDSGWIYGIDKDAGLRTHPCLVPYSQLPPQQRVKDATFRAIVNTLTRGARPLSARDDAPAQQQQQEQPMSSDEDHLEYRLKSKGLTAPRITPDQIDQTIVSEEYYRWPNTTLTICLLKLRNGFCVTGESAAASFENFDEQVGREIARKNAREKIWALEGYLLRTRLCERSAIKSQD